MPTAIPAVSSNFARVNARPSLSPSRLTPPLSAASGPVAPRFGGTLTGNIFKVAFFAFAGLVMIGRYAPKDPAELAAEREAEKTAAKVARTIQGAPEAPIILPTRFTDPDMNKFAHYYMFTVPSPGKTKDKLAFQINNTVYLGFDKPLSPEDLKKQQAKVTQVVQKATEAYIAQTPRGQFTKLFFDNGINPDLRESECHELFEATNRALKDAGFNTCDMQASQEIPNWRAPEERVTVVASAKPYRPGQLSVQNTIANPEVNGN
jgi:hypothetical protein